MAMTRTSPMSSSRPKPDSSLAGRPPTVMPAAGGRTAARAPVGLAVNPEVGGCPLHTAVGLAANPEVVAGGADDHRRPAARWGGGQPPGSAAALAAMATDPSKVATVRRKASPGPAPSAM